MPRRRSWPSTIRRLLFDVVTLAGLAVTSRAQLAAENLFLRKQLALCQERPVKPRRPDPAKALDFECVIGCAALPRMSGVENRLDSLEHTLMRVLPTMVETAARHGAQTAGRSR